jgi:hypothetical protein
MKIAILEICTPTHYTLLNALIKTYATDPSNTIDVFTLENIAQILQDGGIPDQTTLHIFDGINASLFLKKIAKMGFDRLHICTIESYFEDFVQFRPNTKDLYFHIHDIDLWYDAGISNRLKNLMFDLKNHHGKVRAVARFLKDVLVRQPLKRKILRGLLGNNPYYVVMSTRLKNNLNAYVHEDKILLFPTLINEGVVHNQTDNKGKIRICIPGMITDVRRDYTGLFKILNDIMPQIKGKLMIDLLGKVDKYEMHLADKIKQLQEQGLDITSSLEFIDAKTFDETLAQCDILLNNQIMNPSYTGQYGTTKESGMVFNIVRGSKPAIFPSAYGVDTDFENAILFYKSDDALKTLLLHLSDKSIDIEPYKQKAIELGRKYTPQALYSRLQLAQ